MSDYMVIDGKKIELSEETVSNLKKQLKPKRLADEVREYIGKSPYSQTWKGNHSFRVVGIPIRQADTNDTLKLFDFVKKMVLHFGIDWSDGLCVVSGSYVENYPRGYIWIKVGGRR